MTHICRHGHYATEHWCDDHADHAASRPGVTLAADRETHPTTRLTDEESARIVSASIAPDRVLAGRDGHEGSPPDVLLVEVERILAERTLAADREPTCHCEPYAYIGTQRAGEPIRCERCRGLVDDVATERIDAAHAEALDSLRTADREPDGLRAAVDATDQPEVDRG